MNREQFLKLAKSGQISNQKLSDLDLSKANLKKLVFEDCELTRVNFTLADLTATQFKRCNLYACEFRYTDLKNADFEDCLLRHFIVYHCNLTQAIFENVRVIEPARVWSSVTHSMQFETQVWGGMHSGYVQRSVNLQEWQAAKETHLAELGQAEKQAEIEAERAAAQAEFDRLASLPTSHLLKQFNASPDDLRLAKIIDQRLG